MHQGPGSFASFRGVRVFEAREFEIDELHIDLLRRREQIGEHYWVRAPPGLRTPKSEHYDTLVYCEDKDDWHRYTIHDCIEAAQEQLNGKSFGDFNWSDDTIRKLNAVTRYTSTVTPQSSGAVDDAFGDLGSIAAPVHGYCPKEHHAAVNKWAKEQHLKPIGAQFAVSAAWERCPHLDKLAFEPTQAYGTTGRVERRPMTELDFTAIASCANARYHALRYHDKRAVDAGPQRRTLRDQAPSAKKARGGMDEFAGIGSEFEMVGSAYVPIGTNATLDARWASQSIDLKAMWTACDGAHPFPFSFLLARPRMTYDMGSAILMKGGAETGNTFVGYNDFQLGDDIVTKIHHGHYTYYSKAVVKNEKNIMIAHNIFASGYRGGNDSKIVRGPTAGERAEVMRRRTASTVVLLANYDERDQKSNPLHLFSTHQHAGSTGIEAGQEGDHSPANWKAYKNSFAHLSEDNDDDPFAEARVGPVSNDQTWQGCQFTWASCNPEGTMGGLTHKTRNTGHWGDHVYPGCAAVRNGQMKYFEKH
jgi:hypothetical protein